MDSNLQCILSASDKYLSRLTYWLAGLLTGSRGKHSKHSLPSVGIYSIVDLKIGLREHNLSRASEQGFLQRNALFHSVFTLNYV